MKLNVVFPHAASEPMQSAYKQFHSTETALVKVHDDIMWAMERKGVTILILLDLSSAFDTIDHQVLVTRLKIVSVLVVLPYLGLHHTCQIGLNACALICHSQSPRRFGVPQGSGVLGPLLFLTYILPIGDIVRRHGMDHGPAHVR